MGYSACKHSPCLGCSPTISLLTTGECMAQVLLCLCMPPTGMGCNLQTEWLRLSWQHRRAAVASLMCDVAPPPCRCLLLQVSGALNPDGGEGAKAFQECVLARHPRHGEYAIAFITGRTVLQTHEGDLRLTAVYIPTNHVSCALLEEFSHASQRVGGWLISPTTCKMCTGVCCLLTFFFVFVSVLALVLPSVEGVMIPVVPSHTGSLRRTCIAGSAASSLGNFFLL